MTTGRDTQSEWQPLLDELEQRRAAAYDAGGEARTRREHDLGRFTARERIDMLCDPGSFLEFGTFTTTPTPDRILPSSMICGLAEIDGRPVAVGAEDYTVEAGAVGIHLRKIKGSFGGFIEELAYGYRIPLVLLLQGVGGNVYLQELKGYAELVSSLGTAPMFDLLDRVPVVTAVLGPAAGSSAARAGISHFSIMSEPHGCCFAAGPPLVKTALGLEVDKFQLGGVDVHTRRSGLINNPAIDEPDAFAQIRRFLSFLPSEATSLPPTVESWTTADPNDLFSVVSPNGRRAYDVHALISGVFDTDSFFEMTPNFGPSLRTGLARLEGMPVGVLATDNRHLAGSMNAPAARKQADFVRMCDRFGLPLVYLVDAPGFLVGPEAEAEGVLTFGADALRAIHEVTVPVYTVQVRRSFGLGGQATGNPGPTSLRLSWPSGIWGDMPVQGGIEAAFKAELENSADKAALRAELEERFRKQTSTWTTVERFGVDEMIDPRDTRKYLGRLLRLARHSRAAELRDTRH
ncbi:acyl-CoA carboxylase subunit beta [Rhodococcus wratislaviensis]|uniref:acyl-CoA carboxylase subunit beta n=1 Tax=Rhodococcus wratislaviensis TaxID=44752 RepID=UPI0035130FF5